MLYRNHTITGSAPYGDIMKRLSLLLIILVFTFILVNCQMINTYCSLDKTTNPQYFPDKAFNQNGKPSDDLADWYSKYLVALQEPSLYEFSMESNMEFYRILILPTRHSPVSFRIMISADGTGSLFVKMTDGQGGYEAGKLIKNFTIRLTKDQLDNFLNKLNKAHFWELKPYQPPIVKGVDNGVDEDGFTSEEYILDGTAWVYEGAKDGIYHVVSNMSPDDVYADVGKYIIQLSGL
jgi:hypothetical protein